MSLKAPRRILITGMSGLIGNALRRHSGAGDELRALNRRPIPGVECHQADVADLEAIAPAFAGVDVVVHLAAKASQQAPFEEILRSNVVGTHNVFEAARQASVKRVVFASSGAVVSGYERDEPYRSLVAGRYDGIGRWPILTHESPLRPSGLYGASKVWGEALGRHYADAHGMSVICLRIGHVTGEDRPLTPRDFSVWCSQRDIARMIELAIGAPEHVRFDVFYVVSRNRWGYRDLDHAGKVLGFEPADAAEDHR